MLGRRVGAVSICLLGLGVLPAAAAEPPAGQEEIRTGKVFRLEDIEARRLATGRPWLEFLTVPDLSLGLYALAKGEDDPQTPHLQDEVYVVMKGKAVVVIDGERTPVEPGSIIYVVKGVEHRFEDVEEDLEVLVLFAVGKEGP